MKHFVAQTPDQIVADIMAQIRSDPDVTNDPTVTEEQLKQFEDALRAGLQIGERARHIPPRTKGGKKSA